MNKTKIKMNDLNKNVFEKVYLNAKYKIFYILYFHFKCTFQIKYISLSLQIENHIF